MDKPDFLKKGTLETGGSLLADTSLLAHVHSEKFPELAKHRMERSMFPTSLVLHAAFKLKHGRHIL